MQSFIARACAWICATSALSFASSLMVAPFFVFSTFTFAFAAIACGSHIPAPIEPCIEPELLMSEPELIVPELVLPLVPVPDVPDVLLPLVPDVPPVVPVMLPLLLVPEPEPVPVPDVEPELPCAWTPTASASANTATIVFMTPPWPDLGPRRNLGMEAA
jgi:hypothetical protein